MTTRSRLSSGVRTLAGGPSDSPLPDGLPEYCIYEVLTDVEAQMLIDINLSDQNRRVTSKTIDLDANSFDFGLNSTTLSVPAFAQLKINPTDTWWEPVDIVNLSSLDQSGIDGRIAVAFYGNPLRGRLSWVPQTGERHQLTVWFDRSIDTDGSLTAEPPIEDAYLIHLKLQAVAQCLELMNKPIGEALKLRIAKGEQQWERYVRQSGQQGQIKKPSSYPRAGGRSYGGFQRPGGSGWV